MKCNVSDKLYIDRTAAIMTAMNYDGNGTAQDASQDIAAALGCIPAADVAHVRHGKWVKCKMSAWAYRQWYECSECGEPAASSYGHPARTNFCSNCGAKMKEWTHDD